MIVQTAIAIVEQLYDAGLNISLAPAGGLAVAPSRHLTADLRAIIRSSRALLFDWLTATNDAVFDWLTATNDAVNQAQHPPENPVDWKELAAAYNSHYFNCLTCIAAGRGSRYG